MKKRIIASILGLCILALTGCACEHQWSEADCLNPSTCAECGETQGEALGHDWTEATCLKPETCSRCGETQGEVTGHIYGEWALGETDMSRSCQTCGESESSPIDYKVFLDQQLPGHWNVYLLILTDGSGYGPEALATDNPDPGIVFYEDGTAKSRSPEADLTWTIAEAEYNADNGYHLIGIETQSDDVIGSYGLVVYPDTVANGNLLELSPYTDINMIFYNKYDGETLAPLMEGSWCYYANGQLYNITFGEDRSFTGNIDGEVSGYWQPRPIDKTYGMEADILFTYDKDGESKTIMGNFYSPYAEITEEQKDQLNLSIQLPEGHARFAFGTEEEFEAAVSEAADQLCGLWTSTSVSHYNGYSNEETATAEYSINLNEDGSFTAVLDKEISGSWTLASVEKSYGSFDYDVLLSSELWSEPQNLRVGNYNTSLSVYEGGSSVNYYFEQMTEEEVAAFKKAIEDAPKMIMGQWEGSSGSAVFNEDGTMSFELDAEYSGTWSFSRMYISNGVENYYYNLNNSDFLNAELEVQGESMKLILHSSGGHYSFFPPAEFAEQKKEQQNFLGRWTGDTLTVNGNNGPLGEETGDYYLDINEDGSFTGFLGEDVYGSWEYYDQGEKGPRYVFYFGGDKTSGRIYELEGDSFRSFFDRSDGNFGIIMLSK